MYYLIGFFFNNNDIISLNCDELKEQYANFKISRRARKKIKATWLFICLEIIIIYIILISDIFLLLPISSSL